MSSLPKLSSFPSQTYDKLRYGDTDRQGHVNNAVFATFLETGRVALLEAAGRLLHEPGLSFVTARVNIDFHAEIFWPGTVEIGTAVKTIGNSSITFAQVLFQAEKCVATAESVVVRVDTSTHRSTPLNETMRSQLGTLLLAMPEA